MKRRIFIIFRHFIFKRIDLSNCKQCSSCKEILELSRFQTDLSHSDGLRGQCKTCRNQKAKESRLKRKGKVNESVISEFCMKNYLIKNNFEKQKVVGLINDYLYQNYK